MNYDFDKSLDVSETESSSIEQKQEWLRGFEFVYQRIKDILQYEDRFDGEDIKEITMNDDHIHVHWSWIEYGRCGDTEQHDEYRKISYDSIFSESEEEAEKNRLREEARKRVEEQQRKEAERRRIQKEREDREQEQRERAELARLSAKYNG